MRKGVDWLMHVHEASDAATRVALYNQAVNEAKSLGITDKKVIDNFAAFRAREYINFSLAGKSQTLATVRAYTPFFSAQINGLDTLARAAVPGTLGRLNKTEAAKARRMFITRAGILSMISAGIAMQMQDDEDYVNSPDWITNWLLPPEKTVQWFNKRIHLEGNEKIAIPDIVKNAPFFKAPIPFEIGFFFKIIPEIIVRLNNGTLTKKQATADAIKGAIATLAPAIPISQLIKPAAEVLMDHDLYTGRPIESASDRGKIVEERSSKASRFGQGVFN